MTSVLGIDIGTQSVKAVVYDAEAKECVEAGAAPLDLLPRVCVTPSTRAH